MEPETFGVSSKNFFERIIVNESIVYDIISQSCKNYGYKIVDAKQGLLACGVVGDGCLADNSKILEEIKNQLK